MLVVLGHAGTPGFAGGFVGVDVFFVLSGFLITGLLLKEQSAEGRIAYAAFLVRRLRRLFPALVVMLLAVLVAATCLLSAYGLEQQTQSFPFALTWVSNLYFAYSEHQYFDVIREQDLFIHTWSLGVEEQFYLFWPLLLIAAIAMARKFAPTGGQLAGPLIAFVVVSIASVGLNVLWYSESQLLSFYMMPARAWQFALGASVYLVTASIQFGPAGRWSSQTLPILLTVTGLLLLFGSSLLLHDDLAYPGAYVLAPSLATAMIILAGTLAPRAVTTRLLGAKPLVWIGDRSYSLYLWHWPILMLGAAYGLFDQITSLLFYLAGSLLIAAVSYRVIEIPFWKGRYNNAGHRRIVLSAILAVVLAFAVYVSIKNHYFESSQPSTVQYDPRRDRPVEIYDSGRNCDSSVGSSEVIPCQIGGGDGPNLAVLLGDSIGAQWSPFLQQQFGSNEWQIEVLTKSACAIVDETWYYDAIKGDYTICTEWRDSALDYIAARQPKLLVIGSSAEYKLTELQWSEGTSRILQRASEVAETVVIIPGTPRLSFDGPECLNSPDRFSEKSLIAGRTCAEYSTNDQAAAVAGYLAVAAARFDNVHVVEVADLVCPNEICAAVDENGSIVFRDTSHLTVRFVSSISEQLGQRFESLVVWGNVDDR